MSPVNVPSLELHHLSLQLNHKNILNDISFKLEAAKTQCIGLLGMNGAGKSTMFKCIAGIENRYTGSLSINNQRIDKLPPNERTRLGISWLAQESWLFWDLSLKDNLIAIAQMMKLEKVNYTKKISSLTEEFGLRDLLNTKARHLSGGEKKRLEICRLLLSSPCIALLDEPFTGLDPKAASEFEEVLIQLKARKDFHMIISDHQVDRVFKTCQDVFLLDQGKLVLNGTPEEVMNHPLAQSRYF